MYWYSIKRWLTLQHDSVQGGIQIKKFMTAETNLADLEKAILQIVLVLNAFFKFIHLLEYFLKS